MLSFVTEKAQEKLTGLLEFSPDAVGFRFLCHPFGGVTLEPMCHNDNTEDIILSYTPLIYTDLFTMFQLQPGAIDYCLTTNEIVISRDSNAIYSVRA